MTKEYEKMHELRNYYIKSALAGYLGYCFKMRISINYNTEMYIYVLGYTNIYDS